MINTVEKIYLNGDFVAYQITYNDSNIKVSCPHDEENRHYQEILEWVAQGNTITDPGA